MRILSVDFGTRRTGLAISDPSGRLASPVRTLENRGLEWVVEAVMTARAETGAERILVGVPLLADGSVGEGARRALELAYALQAKAEVPVTWLNEAFTTAEAYARLKSLGGKRRTPQEERKIIDQLAATLLLEEYLGELPCDPRPLPPMPEKKTDVSVHQKN
ncbi:MAG: Holliday junction resolvase RuvX [Myxococcota bacterium]